MTRRIAALFATMNRKETAVSCVMALAAQTRPPALVVVADNRSDDGTADALERLSHLPFPLIVHRMAENRGNAGGIEEAMEIAFADTGCEAVWLLDDDSWPRPDALEALLDADWQDDCVRHSIQIDPASGDLTWPMQVLAPHGDWKVIHSIREWNGSACLPTRNNWTGSLVTRRVRERIGPVNGALFIRGEDEEYPWRMEEAGVRQSAVPRSVLDHPGPPKLIRISLLGKRLFFEPGLSDWKLYYKIRNMVWLQRRKAGSARAIGMLLIYAWAVTRHDGILRLAVVRDACRDAWRGKLGRWCRHP